MTDAQTECPPDSDLMRAWNKYQETDGFKNSLMWATATTYRQAGSDVPDHANAISNIQREQHAKGSLWAAFMAGFAAAGGKMP